MTLLVDTPVNELKILSRASLVVLLFTSVISTIGYVIGLQYALPNARIFTIIGVHSWVPIAFALICFLVFQLLRGELFRRAALQRIFIDLTYILLLGIAFFLHFHFKSWVPLINSDLWDRHYWEIDLWLKPFTFLTENLRSWIDGLGLVSFDKFYQLGYIALFAFTFMLVAYVNRAAFHRFALSFLLTVLMGGLSYVLLPAIGPFIFETGLNAEATQAQMGLYGWHSALRANGADWLNSHIADFFGASLAAMPSLHVAYSFLITMAIYHTYHNWLIRSFYTVFLLLVICESVWSKWHYWIDAPAGIALALLASWLAKKIISEPCQ